MVSSLYWSDRTATQNIIHNTSWHIITCVRLDFKPKASFRSIIRLKTGPRRGSRLNEALPLDEVRHWTKLSGRWIMMNLAHEMMIIIMDKMCVLPVLMWRFKNTTCSQQVANLEFKYISSYLLCSSWNLWDEWRFVKASSFDLRRAHISVDECILFVRFCARPKRSQCPVLQASNLLDPSSSSLLLVQLTTFEWSLWTRCGSSSVRQENQEPGHHHHHDHHNHGRGRGWCATQANIIMKTRCIMTFNCYSFLRLRLPISFGPIWVANSRSKLYINIAKRFPPPSRARSMSAHLQWPRRRCSSLNKLWPSQIMTND